MRLLGGENGTKRRHCLGRERLVVERLLSGEEEHLRVRSPLACCSRRTVSGEQSNSRTDRQTDRRTESTERKAQTTGTDNRWRSVASFQLGAIEKCAKDERLGVGVWRWFEKVKVC